VSVEKYDKEKRAKKTVLKFYATWCGPCKIYEPIFEETAKNSLYTDIYFATIDIDQNPDLSIEYEIQSIPTTLFLKNEEVVARKVGVLDKTEIADAIEKLF
jgi:thioredoxin 1